MIGAGFVHVTDGVAFAITRLETVTGEAALKLVLPGCRAVMARFPSERKVTMLLETEARLVSDTVYTRGRAELAVPVKSTLPPTVMAPTTLVRLKMIVWLLLPASVVGAGPPLTGFVLPMPNWPPSLNPLAKRAPDASRMKVWNPPPAISLAPKSAGTSVGRNSL